MVCLSGTVLIAICVTCVASRRWPIFPSPSKPTVRRRRSVCYLWLRRFAASTWSCLYSLGMWSHNIVLDSDSSFNPLLGRTRSRGRCWATIRLSHRPESSDHAVHEVDGLDIGNHTVDGLFFCATLTGCRGGHTPFVQAGSETSNTGVEAVKANPRCSTEGSSRRVVAGVKDESTESRNVVRSDNQH